MTFLSVRGTLTCAVGALSLLAIVSTASAAQDRFGRRGAPPPADSSRARKVESPARPAPSGSSGAAADPNARLEREDFGVAPTRTLHDGPMHGPTPASIPGGQIITTTGLLDLARRRIPHVIVDVLGGPDMLPNAIQGAWLSQPGSFNDDVQSRAVGMLTQATGGRKDTPLVFYCQSPHCWMSYNAALRAINAGFTSVLWYRGGVEAWRRNGGR